MQRKSIYSFMSFALVLILVSLACATTQPTPTSTPRPTGTASPTATDTPRPSPTLRPTRTPNLAETQRANELNAEVQAYFDKGYLNTTDGRFRELEDFSYDWAQLGWYNWLPLHDSASDFFMGGHFK